MLTKIFQKSSLKFNILANFSGNALMAVINILFIPLYLRYIGSEGYGLIGLFATIQSLLYVLDTGFSTTLNKELAGLSAVTGNKQKIANLVKTLESVYWPVSFLVGVIAIIASYFLANSWVQTQGLSERTIFQSFILLSITFVFQVPVGFYAGGLLGLQRHVLFNTVRVFFALLKNVGAVIILVFYSTSVTVFFSWNLLITVITVFIFRLILKKLISNGGNKAEFDKSELKRVAKFSGGMATIALSATLMMQADKVILSKRLLLSDFGYYTLSITLGMAVLQVIGPIAQSFFPKFSNLASLEDNHLLKETYHKSSQIVSIIVFPASLILIFYCKEVLMLWTNNEVAVEKTWYIAQLFAIGTALNAMVSILFSMAFALSWTKFIYSISIYSAFIVTPIIIIVTWFYGPEGAAFCWIFTNLAYVFFIPFIINRKFFQSELINWYWNDTLKPLIACVLFFLAIYFLIPTDNFSRTMMMFFLGAVGCLAILVTLLFSNKIKHNFLLLTLKKNNN